MKKKRTVKYPIGESAPTPLVKDATVIPAAGATESGSMVRTQIYLSREEHRFVQGEAARRGKPMAAVLRSFIDEKMAIPDSAWENNPLLNPPVPDPDFVGHEDGAINHDHYIYGCPKKWVKQAGKWVEAPPLPGDYYENAESRAAYDRMLEEMS